MKQYSWTMSGMDDYVFDVTAIAYRRLGNYAQARSATEALRWYIPRANVEFCKLLAKKSPSAVAAILLKGGSIDQQLKRIKRSIGYETEVFA